MTRNKTWAVFLATFGGGLGLHRFYLYGWRDAWAWLHPAPALLGLWGVWRARHYGLDDALSWLLMPLLGLAIAAGALSAVIYALTPTERWNARHNPRLAADHPVGHTRPLTVGLLIVAMMGGTVAFMSSLAIAFQRYFEVQVEAARSEPARGTRADPR